LCKCEVMVEGYWVIVLGEGDFGRIKLALRHKVQAGCCIDIVAEYPYRLGCYGRTGDVEESAEHTAP